MFCKKLILMLLTFSCINALSNNWPKPVFDNKQWQLSVNKNHDNLRHEVYTLKNESVSNWSELITMQFIPDVKDALIFTKKFKKNLKQQCPKVKFDYMTNKQNPNILVWEYVVTQCPGYKPKLEIAKLTLIPNKGLHIFHYATLKTNLSNEEFNDWLVRLFEAKAF